METLMYLNKMRERQRQSSSQGTQRVDQKLLGSLSDEQLALAVTWKILEQTATTIVLEAWKTLSALEKASITDAHMSAMRAMLTRTPDELRAWMDAWLALIESVRISEGKVELNVKGNSNATSTDRDDH
jgi:hypothetical protein